MIGRRCDTQGMFIFYTLELNISAGQKMDSIFFLQINRRRTISDHDHDHDQTRSRQYSILLKLRAVLVNVDCKKINIERVRSSIKNY